MTTIALRRTRDLNELLRDTFALAAAHWRALSAVSLAIVVPIELVVYGIGLGWLTSGYQVSSTGAVALEYGVSLFLEGPLTTAVSVAVLLQVEAGSGVSARGAIQRGLDAFVALVAAAALYALLVLIGLPTIILAALAFVRLALCIPALVVERASPTAALRRSAELTRGAFWRVLGLLLAIGLVLALPATVIEMIFDSLAKSADAQAIWLVGSMLSSALAVPIAAIFTALLYFDLVERAAGERATDDEAGGDDDGSAPDDQ